MLQYSQQLPIGWEAPQFELLATDNQNYSLEKFAAFKGLVIIFTCNHCREAQKTWMMLRQLHLDYFSKVGFLAINSDDSSTFNEDTILGNLTTVQEYQLQFPYLIDSEQTVAKAFRALTLPEAFLFKNEGGGYFSLFYHGRLVSNDTQLTVADQPLSVALSRFVRDQDPPLIQKPSQGCGITWI